MPDKSNLRYDRYPNPYVSDKLQVLKYGEPPKLESGSFKLTKESAIGFSVKSVPGAVGYPVEDGVNVGDGVGVGDGDGVAEVLQVTCKAIVVKLSRERKASSGDPVCPSSCLRTKVISFSGPELNVVLT